MDNLEDFIQLWATFMILIIILLWIYKIALFFVWSFLETIKDKHKLELDAQNRKDLEFLQSVKEISKVIRLGDEDHKEAHRTLGEEMKKWHINISGRLDTIENLVSKK